MKKNYTLSQNSLKKLGVPEKFENIFDNVFKDDDCNIYVAKGDEMHLLAKNSYAYPISRAAVKLPDEILDMQKRFYRPSTTGEKLLEVINERRDFWNLNFVLVTEGIYTHEMKVFARSATCDTDYGELPEWDNVYIGGSAKALIAGALPMIIDTDCYKIINFVPMFETASGTMIFWAGDKELFEVCYFKDKALTFRYFGRIEKLIQTRVSNLLEIRKINERVLYHIGKTLNFMGVSLLSSNAFKIDEATGKVVIHSAICCGSVHDITSSYLFKDGKYIRA